MIDKHIVKNLFHGMIFSVDFFITCDLIIGIINRFFCRIRYTWDKVMLSNNFLNVRNFSLKYCMCREMILNIIFNVSCRIPFIVSLMFHSRLHLKERWVLVAYLHLLGCRGRLANWQKHFSWWDFRVNLLITLVLIIRIIYWVLFLGKKHQMNEHVMLSNEFLNTCNFSVKYWSLFSINITVKSHS